MDPERETDILFCDESLPSPVEYDPDVDGILVQNEEIDLEGSEDDIWFDPIPRRDMDPPMTRDYWF